MSATTRRGLPVYSREVRHRISGRTEYRRIGGEEHSGEFLVEYIFTQDSLYNGAQWRCIGFKIQYVHFVHMPDLRGYLVNNKDIRIIVTPRRHLLEHAAAEVWCRNRNSRGGRVGAAYEFGNTKPVEVSPGDLFGTMRNLCRYREDAIRTFDQPDRMFMEWSLEDMFDRDQQLDEVNHEKLFNFLDSKTSHAYEPQFAKTPRPTARDYFTNYEETNSSGSDDQTQWGGAF